MSRSQNNNRAIALQEESLAEQKRVNAQQLQFMNQQLEALRKNQVAPYKPTSPPPTPGTSGADFAAAQERIASERRFGYNNTVRGGMRFGGRAA